MEERIKELEKQVEELKLEIKNIKERREKRIQERKNKINNESIILTDELDEDSIYKISVQSGYLTCEKIEEGSEK